MRSKLFVPYSQPGANAWNRIKPFRVISVKTKRLVCVLLRWTPKGLCICWSPLSPSLDHYGVTGCSLTWFRNYLTARSQAVQYEKELSSSLPLDFGVPLSSLLEPLLFVIDVNDLPQCLVHSAIKFVCRWHSDVLYWVRYQHHQRKSERRPQTSRVVIDE